jgi:hypothetical protein
MKILFHYNTSTNPPLGGKGGKKGKIWGQGGNRPYTFLRNAIGILSIRF